MIVTCKYNKGNILPNDLLSLAGWDANMEFNRLTIDALYVVYGISIIKDHEWFLICEDGFNKESSNFPIFLPNQLFETVNMRPSIYWIRKIQVDNYTGKEVTNIGIPELLEDEYFYSNLLEDSIKEVNIFLKYKKMIDNEVVSFLKNIKYL
jgi:hypothetical protein